MSKKEWICIVVLLMLASLGFAQEGAQGPDAAQARSAREIDVDKPSIDWEAKYEAFLKENPGVARAVESGKISKKKVIAGIMSSVSTKISRRCTTLGPWKFSVKVNKPNEVEQKRGRGGR